MLPRVDLSIIDGLHPTFEPEHGLLLLSLDHGKANEMGTEQLAALERLCDLVNADQRIRCVCTRSTKTTPSGKSVFVAGANVTERSDWDDARVKKHVRRQRAVMEALSHLPAFTVAVVDGVTLGWGVEYLLTQDYVLSTSHASYGLPETGLGILPGARGTAELAARVGLAQALRLGCTGELVRGDEALRIGLVQEIHGDAVSCLQRARELSISLLRRSPTAVAAYKQALLAAQGRPSAERLEEEARAYELCVDSGEAAIGRASFATSRGGAIPPWGPRVTKSRG